MTFVQRQRGEKMTEIIIKVNDDFLEQAKIKGMESQYELIRCKDCVRYEDNRVCDLYHAVLDYEDYCSRAERREE